MSRSDFGGLSMSQVDLIIIVLLPQTFLFYFFIKLKLSVATLHDSYEPSSLLVSASSEQLANHEAGMPGGRESQNSLFFCKT